MAGTILQQSFVVEYIVNHQMCDDCRRVEAKDTWNASVSFTIEYFLWFVTNLKQSHLCSKTGLWAWYMSSSVPRDLSGQPNFLMIRVLHSFCARLRKDNEFVRYDFQPYCPTG